MNLYYEDVPATDNEAPQLPPLLRSEAMEAGTDVLAKAISRAAAGEVGLVCYSQAAHVLDMAITLAPEVPAARAQQMHYTMMNAVGDAIGALAPPEVGVRYSFPGNILFNRGHAGIVRMAMAPTNNPASDIPDWLVVSAQVRLAFADTNHDTEYRMANTSLAEEGGGFISRTRLLESSCRHFLVWVHQWEEEGFRPVHEKWLNRIEDDKTLTSQNGGQIAFVGIDDEGAGLLSEDGAVRAIPLAEASELFGRAGLAELE